jgi:hypothetical protein
MKDLWDVAIVTPLREFLAHLGAFLPNLLAMVVIIIAGLVAAAVIKLVVFRILRVTRFDQLCTRVGFAQVLTKGGITDPPSMLISRILFWAVILLFLVMGLEALQITTVNRVAVLTISYVPHLLVAVIILVVGFILSNFFGRAALIAAVNAQISQARLLARGVRLAVILFAMAMAFEQLGIATTIIVAAFSITFGGAVLALAIAFGLGGRDAAKAIIDGRLKGSNHEPKTKEDEVSHL